MPKPQKTRPTILDVADLSGVSYQTVSRVINNHPYVSDEARRKVQKAIDKLGYRPHKAASKLRAKSSKTVAIILYGSWFPGPMQIALNVELAARTSGFDVMLASVTETQKQVTEALQHMRDWDVDGVAMIMPVQGLHPEEVAEIAGNIPVVYIDAQPSSNSPSVTLNDRRGTEQVIEHLIEQGHARFCEISGPLDWYSAQLRHQTSRRVFEKHNISCSMHVEGNWTTPGGYQATRRLLEKDQSFTAIVAANDSMALGAYRALHQAGLTIPGDVSIVGYDDIPEAAYYCPPLTTVRVDHVRLGMAGFEYLIQLLDDPETTVESRLIEPKLIVRDSTIPVHE